MAVIGVLGGSFDPIHLGHKALGMAAVEEVALDTLIVMPAHIQPFKQNKKVAEIARIFNGTIDIRAYFCYDN